MTLDVALFGCGGFARNHLRELGRRDDVMVRYLVDLSQSHLDECAKTYFQNTAQYPQKFSSLYDFENANPVFDAAIIVTPPNEHYIIANAILEMGKHVYVEKPFTLTKQAAVKLADLASRKGLEIVCGENRRVYAAFKAGAMALKAGAVGELKGISIYYQHTWEKNTKNNWRQNASINGSGILADHSPHYHNFLYFLGFRAARVLHLGSRYNKKGVDVKVSYMMTDDNGRVTLIVMDGSPKSRERKEVVRLIGESGEILIRFENGGSAAYVKGQDSVKMIGLEGAISEIKDLGIDDYRSHPAMIHNFVGLLNGKTHKNANPGYENILPVHWTELLQKLRGDMRETTLAKKDLLYLTRLANSSFV